MLAENAGIDIFCVDYYKKMSITTTFNPLGKSYAIMLSKIERGGYTPLSAEKNVFI